jgi:hypothetical protein
MIQGVKAIPLVSLIKFMFQRMDKSPLCESFTKSIEKCIANSMKVDNSNELLVFDLYTQIASSDIGVSVMPYLSSGSFDKEPSWIVNNLQNYFTEKEWEKIVLFEKQFDLQFMDPQPSMDDTKKAKWDMWHSYCQMKTLSKSVITDIQTTIKRREARKQAANISKEVFVHSKRRHLRLKIEKDLCDIIRLQHPHVQSVTVVDCEDSIATNSLIICIDVASNMVPVSA